MKDYITVDSETTKTIYSKKAFAVLSACSTYQSLYDSRQNVASCAAHILNKVRETCHDIKINCDYLKKVTFALFRESIKDQIGSVSFDNYQEHKDSVQTMIRQLDSIDTAIKAFSSGILELYGIDIERKDIRDENYHNLEAKAQYSDSGVTKFIYGDMVSKDEQAALEEELRTAHDARRAIFSADSVFNKRLSRFISSMRNALADELQIYSEIRKVIDVYDLAMIVFEKEANYKSNIMLSLLNTLTVDSMLIMFGKYIKVEA